MIALLRPEPARLELWAVSADAPSSRPLALARQVHGTEMWALARSGVKGTSFAEGETAARAWLQDIAEISKEITE